MYIVGIIPARMASSRFPGKPLAKINGIPMLGHVYFRSRLSKTLDALYVATCDQVIADYVTSIGGRAIMTADTHERAADRTAEAVGIIEREIGRVVDIVVMIQGDEPMVLPGMIDSAVAPLLQDETLQVVNLMGQLKSLDEHADLNEVKVTVDLHNFALYFSREAIPSRWKGNANVPLHKQVCIIPFRRTFLATFNALPSTPLEIAESIDMLRVLEHGYRVKMVPSEADTYSVDTPDDLARVAALLEHDPLVALYRSLPS